MTATGQILMSLDTALAAERNQGALSAVPAISYTPIGSSCCRLASQRGSGDAPQLLEQTTPVESEVWPIEVLEGTGNWPLHCPVLNGPARDL
jgi:hypothetical protein